jgi:hypothetical protein
VSLTAVSLFAGVGGFDLAMERNGIDVVAAVEIDEKARAVLARRFPNTRLFADVTKVSSNELRDAGFVPDRGIITGGFPCQDLSVAGRRAGLAGERSGLFWHIIRLVDELHPRWIVLENVPSSSCHQKEEGIWESSSGRWETAGMASPTECWTLSTSESPSDGGACSSSLADVLEQPTVPGLSRYCLSPKAAQGILRRAGRRGRSLPEPLETALQAVASSTRLPETGSEGGGPDDNLAQAGHLIPQQPLTPVAIQAASEQSLESISSSSKNATRERERERERERSPLLASSSRMQSVASTITTGTGLRMDPDTESLVIT